MQSGKVTGYEITENKGSEKKKLILQLEISDPEDIQSIQLLSSSGEVSNPPEGSKVITLPIGTNGYKVGVAVDDNIEPEQLEPGEKIIYSSDDSVIKSKIHLKKTGEINILNDKFEIKALPSGQLEIINENGSFKIKNDGTIVNNEGVLETARKSDTTKLTLSVPDVVALATLLIATGAFVPTGSAPVGTTPIVFTSGEITSGTSEVLMP